MKIYTRNGDNGQTRLVDGQQISKSHPRLEAYGTIDELNSMVGLCLFEAHTQSEKFPSVSDLLPTLQFVQHSLFNSGSWLACQDEQVFARLPKLPDESASFLEKKIDQMSGQLPELRNFILPGGSSLACHLHLARTLCRRAERLVVGFLEKDKQGHEELTKIVVFLNRLSDYFFVAARWANQELGVTDHLWQKDVQPS